MFPKWPQRWIVAHRGVSDLFPENTRAAFDAAVMCGADAIECDVQLTADDQIVICHDPMLDRYGHTGVCIAESSLHVLRTLNIGSWFGKEFFSERLMILDELLGEFGGRIPLLLEVKAEEISPARKTVFVQRLVHVIKSFDLTGSVAVLCFDANILTLLNQCAPDISLVLNTHDPSQLSLAELENMPWLSAVDGNIDHLTCDLVKRVHDVGLVSLCFTCNNEVDVTKAWDIGVAAIITNHPDRTRQMLKIQKRIKHDS